MFSGGIAVLTLTRHGIETSVKIKKVLEALGYPCMIYAPSKIIHEGIFPMETRLDDFIREKYQTSDALVAVMATGIIIRAVAPYLQSKLIDPAVIGVDTKGRFIISLLSGHYGGANELTHLIAEGIGAMPVITTASEVLGKQSIDTIARALHLKIVNPNSLVAVNGSLVNDGKMGLILVGDLNIPTDIIHGYNIEKADSIEKAIEVSNKYDAVGIITQESFSSKEIKIPATFLKPKNIILGIGARKEISENQIIDAIENALARVRISLERVDGLATVDIKKESQSMTQAAETINLKFKYFTIEQLNSVKHLDLSPDSEMVKEKIGVGGVSERAAILAAGKNPKLILKKQKLNGVTVAIAEGE